MLNRIKVVINVVCLIVVYGIEDSFKIIDVLVYILKVNMSRRL